MSTENRAETTCKCPDGLCRCGHSQPAGQLCGCPIFTTHTTHGNPWCQCGHQYAAHTSPGAACTMTASPISDDMIEQAAKAACEFVYPPKTNRAWEDVDDYEQDSWRATAGTLLEAAYSAIRQQVAEEIAAKGNEIAEEYQATAITHRDLSDEHGRTLKGTSHMTTAHAYRNKADGAWAVAHAAREIGGAA